MGKYLDEIVIFPCNLFEHEDKIEFAKGTAGLLKTLNSHFQKNIRSKFGKVVVMLWPKDELIKDPGITPPYELDAMSNVAVINIEYNISNYVKTPDISDRNRIACDILRKEFTKLPGEFGLDGKKIIEIIDGIKGVSVD